MNTGITGDAAVLLKTRVDALDYDRVLSRIDGWMESRRETPAIIVQSNVFTLVNACENAEYREAVESAELSVPDGMPLVWLLRKRGYPVADRVYGPDLMLKMCARAAGQGWRCFLFGGKPGVPEKLAVTLQQRFPGLIICGVFSPPFIEPGEEEDQQICSLINNARPDIVWVGLGSPKQDFWMVRHRDRLHASVLHGVGAAFDFFTGSVKQAPPWMQRNGLEWLYRLLSEPGRLWKRYTVSNAKFLYYLLTVRKRAEAPTNHQ